VPYFEQFIREDVVERWHKEGLPKGVNVEQHFRLDHREVLPLKRSLRELNRSKFPYVDEEEDLPKLHAFLDSALEEAYPRNWNKLVEGYRKRDYPVGVAAWESGMLQFLGVIGSSSLERACLMMYDKRKLVHSIIECFAEYLMDGIEQALGEVELDFAYFTEPIAGSYGPVISPAMFREFVIPWYKKMVALLKRRGIDIIIMRSFGNIEVLLPDMVDAGITGLWMTDTIPSNMDYMAIRREYGRKLGLIGGIDARVLIRDDEAIRKEIYEKVPPLLESGGYIPTIDNRARSHISFKKFAYYRKLLEEVCNS
jgi:uroporphyrinogen decarboxylase